MWWIRNAIERSSFLWRHSFFFRTVVWVMLTEIILWGLQDYWKRSFSTPLFGGAEFISIPVFVSAMAQLSRTEIVQRSAMVKDLVSQVYTNSDLSEAFHDLIRTYDDQKFDQLDRIKEEKKLTKLNDYTPIFEPFECLQEGRKEPRRFYHPDVFMGSSEERRLDSFLGYLDLVGYHYCQGLVRMNEIATTIGYHLSFLRANKVMKKYLADSSHRNWWVETKYFEQTHSQGPFTYLRILLDEFELYGRRHSESVQRMLERHKRQYERMRRHLVR